MATSTQSKQPTSQEQNCGAEDFPARIYLLRTKESEPVLPGLEADCSTSSRDSSRTSPKGTGLAGCLWRTFPDCSIQKEERTSSTSSPHWMNSGMAFRGECWTQNTSEHPSDVVVCTLSQVVEPSAPLRYFLNKAQLQSLLTREDARQAKPGAKVPRMPRDLRMRIETQLVLLSNMPELDAFLRRDPKAKDTETMERLLRATPGAAQMLSVRRLLPSEYERLQGFPRNWTRTDGEPWATRSASRSSPG